ncbi:hypothetical protein ACP70R_004594 [Stipagrostis hirtigluma subsp. patula]
MPFPCVEYNPCYWMRALFKCRRPAGLHADARNDVALDHRPRSAPTDGSGDSELQAGLPAAPLTTKAVKVVGSIGAVEAYRSFERHLMEILVEERKVMDLTDLRGAALLLACSEKLQCPAFVQLVGRFSGELCLDLFSGRDTDVSSGSDRLTSV